MYRVVVNGAAPSGPNHTKIWVNDGARNFRLRAIGVPRTVIDQFAHRTLDLLLIAASVFCADSRISRGGDARADFGQAWRRQFRFVVPVIDIDFWNSARDDLIETLNYLTGDVFDFLFTKRQPRLSEQQSIDWEGSRQARADEIILFSGGLDSLTGAVETLTSTDAKLLLVTHRSASKTASMQTALVRELQERFPDRVMWVPARATLVRCKARETTQRSRSFFYAALGYAAASLVGASHVRFFENGIVSLNIPIDRQVVGTTATRTTHPLFLHRLQRLFSKVAAKPISVDNPYAWLTKTEVVTRLRDNGGADLISRTTSCSSVRKRTKDFPYCGGCSQCLDRRFAVLAAGVAEHDPVGRYEVELFAGRRLDPQDRTMAWDWYRHARRLASMPQSEFLVDFAAVLADVVAAHPNETRGRVQAEAFAMHRRHGEAVRSVVHQTIRDSASAVIDQVVPADSLLQLLLASSSDPPRAETSFLPPAHSRTDDQTSDLFPLRLIVLADGARPRLLIRGLSEFRGAHLGLILKLRSFHEADCAAALLPKEHRFVQAGELGNKNTVWSHAKRCRDQFAGPYEAMMKSPLPNGFLLQGDRQHGYRLDPEARFVPEDKSVPDTTDANARLQ